MGTLLTLIPACNRVKATSYRAEVDRYDAGLEANRATNGRLVVGHKWGGKPPISAVRVNQPEPNEHRSSAERIKPR
jgi:hypothetical protein